MLVKVNIAVVLVMVASIGMVSSDVFTSMNRIKDMVLNEGSILTRIERALPDASAKTAFLNFYQQRIQDIRGRNLTREVERLNHPNGAYFIIQEFAKEYEQVRKAVLDSQGNQATKYMAEIADDDDVLGARLSLLRLQEVYGLSVMDMVSGNYLNFRGPNLNSTDAYLVGLAAFTNGKFRQSAQWLDAALQPKSSESSPNSRHAHDEDMFSEFGKTGKAYTESSQVYSGVDSGPILGLLGRALIRTGNKERATQVYEAARRQGSTHGDVVALGQELQNIPASYREERSKTLDDFHRLCAMQSKPTGIFTDRRLRCRYRGVYVPYYRFNEEIVSNIPYVSLFYDIISNKEADHVKAASVEKLYRGVVVGPTGQAASKIRTSHVAFIEDSESHVVRSISNRIGQLTGLDTASPPEGFHSQKQSGSEPLQVVNYGLGGYYSVHMDPYDHVNEDTARILNFSGNRLATFLIYLTDVERGGSTAFPKADIVVSPVKTNAVFWYSFTPAGDIDHLTLHAGCPVVVGEKWIINKWILTYSNTFTRRCGLTKGATQLDIENDMMRGYKPKPKTTTKKRRSSSRKRH